MKHSISKTRIQNGGLLPLYSKEAEQSVLGAMMTHPEDVIDLVTDGLYEDDFFIEANKTIFQAIKNIYKANKHVDMLTVHDWLKVRGKDEEVGSPGTLAECVTNLVSHANVGTYIKIVRENAVMRTLQNVCVEIVQEISNGDKEAEEILDGAERRFTSVTLPDNGRVVPFGEDAEKAIAEALAWSQCERTLRGLDTGLPSLNEMTTGWRTCDFIVIGARPGKGKTALMLKFILSLLMNDIPVQMFSLEMNKNQLILRLAAMHCGLALQHVRHGRMSQIDQTKLREASETIMKWPLYIDDETHQNIDRIRSKMRRAKRKHNVQAIFIDYIGLIEPLDRKENRRDYVADISRALKGMAKELQLPVIAAAQLNRYGAEGEPQEHHIADSDAIARDADMVMLLHELPEGTEKQGANIPYNLLLTKQRSGPTGKIPIIYSSWRALFYEEEKDLQS